MEALKKIKTMKIWHKPSDELPNADEKVIFESERGCFYVGEYIAGGFRSYILAFHPDDVKRWCYIKDILNLTD